MLNDANARFCRNCGLPLGWPQDPVRGTVMRQADLPSERGAGIASIIGLVAAVVILAAAAYLVFRGTGAGGATSSPSPVPTASLVAVGSPTPRPSASARPTPVPTRTPVAGQSEVPQPTPSEPSGTPPTATDFTCDTATVANSIKGHWNITLTHWAHSSRYDTIKLDMTRNKTGGGFPSMTIQSMSLDDVSHNFGITAPPNADRAVVVTLDRHFSSIAVTTHRTVLDTLGGDPMPVVPNFAVQPGTDGLWHVVLGVVGNGCHRLSVPEWGTNASATDAHIVIDVEK
jgi:hypothetical protein